MQEGTDLT